MLRQSKPPKPGRVRTVPMFPGAYEALRALAPRALDRGRHGPAEYVVPTVTGAAHDCSNWGYRVWRPALRKSKLDDRGYRWHDLRHTAVSRLIAQGADIALVQAVAGHSSAATTLRVYAHLTDKRLETAATEYDPMRNLLAKR